MFHGSNLRKYRISSIENIYSITSCTLNREKFLNEFSVARTLIKAFKYHDNKLFTETLAFVVMPDHFHWLFQLKKTNLNSILQRVKSYTSHQFGREMWQQGYHEHTVRANEDIKKLSRYIVSNPLRAGLVKNIEDYPHWDAVWLNGKL